MIPKGGKMEGQFFPLLFDPARVTEVDLPRLEGVDDAATFNSALAEEILAERETEWLGRKADYEVYGQYGELDGYSLAFNVPNIQRTLQALDAVTVKAERVRCKNKVRPPRNVCSLCHEKFAHRRHMLRIFAQLFAQEIHAMDQVAAFV